MKKTFYLIIFTTLISLSSLTFASKNNFQFQINQYSTQRQSGQTLDINIRYAIKDGVEVSQYPDYRELRAIAVKYLEPTESFPTNTFWEVIAEKIGEELMSRYPFSGVSVQMLVYPNEKGAISEPGFHGPIYTVGDVTPLSQVVMPKLKGHKSN